jgi:hypothetical protein
MQEPKRPDEELDDILYEEELHRILKERLNEREYRIIYCRFWQELTLKETGKLVGVNQERIRQIESKALRKLRHETTQREFMKLGGIFGYVCEKLASWRTARVIDAEIKTVPIEVTISYSVDPNGPKPEWVVVERWEPDSQPYLALRIGDVGRIPPLTMEQYNRWLEQALKEEQDALCYRS